MALEVIGSGLGRTGTMSLQSALNLLGFGPCHHMREVFAHPETMALWTAAGEGRADWESIFRGYRSAVDYPTAAYWREVTACYPDARVIHTIRDPDAWFDSTQATIFGRDGPPARALTSDGTLGDFFRSFMREFRDHMHDRAFMTDYFCRHTEAVRAAIRPERLLIYEVKDGWEPLCRFLGVPVPDQPFPSQNDRAEFIARVQASRAA